MTFGITISCAVMLTVVIQSVMQSATFFNCYADCHYVDSYYYAECRYHGGCRFAQCRVANKKSTEDVFINLLYPFFVKISYFTSIV